MDKDLQKNWERIEFALFLHSQKRDDSVAQLVEHDTFNVGVLGSSPSGITKTSDKIRGFFIAVFNPKIKEYEKRNPLRFNFFYSNP